jgi:hypothetical protein
VIVFPIVAALVSLAFGVHLLVRSGRRRRWFEAVWGLAMLMFAAASAALAAGVLDGWSSGEFRVYWLFGAVLNVPFLAQGEVYLLVRNRWVPHALLVVLLIGVAWASATVRTADASVSALTQEFPLGREVFGSASPAYRFAQFYSYPAYFFLVGGAIWSAVRMRGREELRQRFYGVLLIAFGATVVAVGSGIGAGFRNFPLFSIALAAGVAFMYWGFLTTTRRPAAAPAR